MGTSSPDQIVGDEGDDCLIGYGRGDTLKGRSGNDRLFGGSGPDQLGPGTGDDFAAGGSGNDRIVFSGASSDSSEGWGGAGDDVIESGDDASTLHGGEGDDLLLGGAGADTLEGGEGVDIVDGGAGDDLILAPSICDLRAGELVDGGAGSDTLQSPFSAEELEDMGIEVRNIENFAVLASGATDQCDGQPAPTQWLTADGLAYRRATSRELARNNWIPGTYIVERGTGGLYFGQSTATVLLPRSDGDTQTLALTRVASNEKGLFGEISYVPGVPHKSEVILFDTFQHKDPETGDHDGRVVIADDDSLHGRVKNADGEGFAILQLHAHHFMDKSLPKPPMSAADAVVVSPLGGVPPAPEHGYAPVGTLTRFGYVGEGLFCVSHVDDWQAMYQFDAQTVRAVHLNSSTGADMNLVFGTCHFFSSWDEAQDCAQMGIPESEIPSYCYDGDGHPYPFAETMSVHDIYYVHPLKDAAWEALEHAAVHLTIPDMELVQVRTGGQLYNPSEYKTGAGIGDGPNSNPNGGWKKSKGRSVAKGSSSVADIASAHKFGHNFVGDLQHEGAEELDGEYSETIMGEQPKYTTAPWFSAENAELAKSCVDTSYCPVGAAWSSP